MSKFPLPEKAIANHTAVLGKTGSGKTSTAKLIVEHVVDEGYRVCVLDPIKSDWWGLTSSATGKRVGLPFEILGGPRGYVPLHATSGKVIGELVASGKLPLSILDMANFRAGDQQRFFIDFAETLMRKMRGVLYLVIEEAHEFAPKERAGIGNENMAMYWAKKLATAGRSKGLRMILCTQRTQALHNALLGSCETMIVHRMTAPADQEPVKKWLKANVEDREVITTIDAGMSKLATGSAFVCSGEADFIEQVKFPLFRTFDNSAAPKKGAGSDVVVSAHYDVEKLRSLIGEAVAEADANDPAKLRARVAELEKAAKSAKAAPDPAMIAQAERAAEARGFQRGRMESRGKIGKKLREFADSLLDGAEYAGVESIAPHHAAFAKAIDAQLAQIPARTRVTPVSEPKAAVSAATVQREAGLQPSHLKILEALALIESMGFAEASKEQLGAFSGYSTKGGRFANLLGSLRTSGLIVYRSTNVALTDAGRAAAPAADTSRSVRDRIAPVLQPAEAKVLDAIPRGGEIAKVDLAAAAGYEASGGRFNNIVGRLRTLGVVVYPTQGQVALQDWFTE